MVDPHILAGKDGDCIPIRASCLGCPHSRWSWSLAPSVMRTDRWSCSWSPGAHFWDGWSCCTRRWSTEVPPLATAWRRVSGAGLAGLLSRAEVNYDEDPAVPATNGARAEPNCAVSEVLGMRRPVGIALPSSRQRGFQSRIRFPSLPKIQSSPTKFWNSIVNSRKLLIPLLHIRKTIRTSLQHKFMDESHCSIVTFITRWHLSY